MTKSELLELLDEYRDDDDIEILVASDAEGNNYSPLSTIGSNFVNEDGEVIDPEEISEGDFIKEVLVIYPV